MKLIRLFLLFFLTLSASVTYVNAQNNFIYQGKYTYDENSTVLIENLKDHINSESQKSETNANVRDINSQRIKYMKKLVTEKMFINNATFESCLKTIVDRIVDANDLVERPRLILVTRTPAVDATNYGRGIFAVTLGMLARVQSEGELAFALAHEIAHDELGHVQQNVQRRAESERQKKAMQQSVGRIAQGKGEEEDFETIRNAVYQAGRFSRESELKADSMGLVLFTKAGYNPSEALKTFDILKNPTGTKADVGIEILLPLHSEAYELQDHWFNERLSVYSKEIGAPLGLSLDSLKSHPDIDLRKQKFGKHDYSSPKSSYPDSEILPQVIEESEIEIVEICYQKKMYDRCLFYALQLLHKDPDNSYAISRIGKMLLDLKIARDKLTFGQYVPAYTFRYGEHLKLINAMLQNLEVAELGELGYHFISRKDHFNPEDPSHYYIKWKLCDATYRYDEEKLVKKAFREKFSISPDVYSYK